MCERSKRRSCIQQLHAVNNKNSCCEDDKSTASCSDITATKVRKRRDFLVGSSGLLLTPIIISTKYSDTSSAYAATPLPLPIQTASSSQPVRIEEIGGGFDLRTPPKSAISSSDMFYPSSLIGTSWKVQRVVTSVEGDLNQAGVVWKALGGGDERAFTSKMTEVYQASFVEAPQWMDDASYSYENRDVRASILDRSQELISRMDIPLSQVEWDPNNKETSNTIRYTRSKTNESVELMVASRKIEFPSTDGFGSDELYRITSSAGGIFGSTGVVRAGRVRRRYRRGFDESTGKRIIDGIEVTTTYRVMDGVAGIEMPTSTTKSRIRMVQL